MPIRKYLTNRNDNIKFRLNGIKPATRLPNKENLRKSFANHMVLSSSELPPKVDMRSGMTPVENQLTVGSCTANALAGAYEYLLKKSRGEDIDVSRLFIYYNARARKPGVKTITDSGSSMTNGIESLEELGVCLESDWDYDVTKVNTRPDENAYEQAENYRITDALKININLTEMKTCLAQGFPFGFGLRLFKSFDKAVKTGIVPIPSDSEQSRAEHGRHAMLAVGYSNKSKSFIVRNSWGENRGDKGYYYIPYDYMANSKFCFDAWTVRELENDDMGHEDWDEEDDTDYHDDSEEDGDEDDDDDYDIEDIEEDGDEDEDDEPDDVEGGYGDDDEEEEE